MKLGEDEVWQMAGVCGEWVYYYSSICIDGKRHKGDLCRIKTDGTDSQLGLIN